MNIRVDVIVACTNAQGTPMLVVVEEINVTQDEYFNGLHYERAKAAAGKQGYEAPYVAIDKSDMNEDLFKAIQFWAPDVISGENAHVDD